MAEKCIQQRKRLASGEVFNKYAKGGMVMPRKQKEQCSCGVADMKCSGGSIKKRSK